MLRGATAQTNRPILRRLIAPCSTYDLENPEEVVDVGAIIRDLILFDTVILKSSRMREFPSLIAAFGIEGMTALLKSGRLRIHCQAVSIGQTGQAGILEARALRGTLPLGSYSFSVIRIADTRQYLHTCLQELHKTRASLKEIIKLKREVVDALVPWPNDAGKQAVSQLTMDLRANSPIVSSAVELAFRKEYRITGLAQPLALRVEEVAQGDFRVHTNLRTLGFDELAAHKMVERGLLGLGGLNHRVEEMQTHAAVSGFIDGECPLFEARLGFLLKEIAPSAQWENFQRVVEIAGLPEFIPSIDRIDAVRLLEVLDTRECREFREWVGTLGKATDPEIKQRVRSLRARVGAVLHTGVGRSLRFIVSTGLGAIHPLGTVAGAVASAVDSFLIDQILPSSGIHTFVNQMYPSIFVAKSDID
ncbi:MAG: hypothetical protein LLG20_24900 [Acidobacteriales bacterium]|nr:hypothetical protein [Terriglobales bacterium]